MHRSEAMIAAAPAPGTPHARRASRTGRFVWITRDHLIVGMLVAVLVMLYAPLHHRYWTLGGDGDVFLSVARSLAQGEGYRFNGQYVAIIPPGWVWVLSGMMQFSSRFATLKLIPAACVIGFLTASYWVLRRYASARAAAASVLVATILEPIFGLAFQFYSDPLFALICMVALWMALRFREGHHGTGNIAMLAALCAASVMVRWTGVLWMVVIAGVLASGDLRPRIDRRWLTIALCAAVTATTFVALRWALRVDPATVDPRYDTFVSEHYDLLNMDEPARSILHAGHWIGGLLLRVAVAIRASREFANIAGWIAIAFLTVTMVRSMRRRDWLALAAFVYVAVLVVNWPGAMPRYIIPLAPLIVLGLYKGIVSAGEILPERFRDLRWIAVHYTFAAIVLANLILYAIEVYVAQSRDPVRTHMAGLHAELVDTARWLNAQPHDGFEIAISSKMVNFQKGYFTDGSRRALNVLTDRSIVTVPQELCDEPDADFVAWAKAQNVRYYLYQPPVQLIQHFHRSGWHGRRPDKSAMGWRLYEIRDGEAWRVLVAPTRRWPSRLPGM